MGQDGLVAHVVLLAGPSGSGKTHLAEESGLPMLDLDDFYKDGDDPSLPRHPTLGIVDWDDPASWDAAAALAALEQVCREGAGEVPVYDIAHDGGSGPDGSTCRAPRPSSVPASSPPSWSRPPANAAWWPTPSWSGGPGSRTSCAGCAATSPSTGSPR